MADLELKKRMSKLNVSNIGLCFEKLPLRGCICTPLLKTCLEIPKLGTDWLLDIICKDIQDMRTHQFAVIFCGQMTFSDLPHFPSLVLVILAKTEFLAL
jgi:hypothetical protein